MKRRRMDETSNNLRMAQTPHALKFKGKPKKFKRKWNGKPKDKNKVKGVCFKCRKLDTSKQIVQ
jgi:hypothetical protein